MERIVLLGIGVFLIIFSHPRIRRPVMLRLFNEGIVEPKIVKPEAAQIIKHTDGNLTLLLIGIAFIMIGIII